MNHRPQAKSPMLLAMLKRLPAETAAELDALFPALLDKTSKGELRHETGQTF
jgi:hypothetical protein